MQYFGTKGFFHDYNARMNEPLKQATGEVWARGFANLRKGRLDPFALARAVTHAEGSDRTITEAEFTALLPPSVGGQPRKASTPITRGEAVRLLWRALAEK